MLHAPACENKRRSSSHTPLNAQPQREFHPPFASASDRGRGLARLHASYGNQDLLRMISQFGPTIQAKLTVNQPGDAFEHEADRVADHVMRMTAPEMVQQSAGNDGKLQRKCAECEEEKKTGLQKKEAGAGPQVAPASVHNVLNSPGRPLDPVTRAFMEPRFGYDFSQVQVHDDQRASNSARAVNALAYTVGNHVVFRNGLYDSGSQESKRLIAHELAHVVQQGGVAGNQVQREPETEDEKEQTRATAGPAETPAPGEKKKTADTVAPQAPKVPKSACNRTILSEGSCADLVAGSKFICCDPGKGFERKGKTKDVEGTDCPDQKFSPIFTCDHNCKTALSKGCSDNDNWIAVPPGHKGKCGDVFTICANGKSTTGYMRDRSVTHHSFEVSPGIQKILGVTVGSSFKGSVYRPGASADTIAKDKCCNS